MTLNMIQFHLQVPVRTCSFLQQELIGMKKYRRALIVILTVFMFITQQGCSAKTAEPVARQNFYFVRPSKMPLHFAAAMNPCSAGQKKERTSTGSIMPVEKQ